MTVEEEGEVVVVVRGVLLPPVDHVSATSALLSITARLEAVSTCGPGFVLIYSNYLFRFSRKIYF